MPGRERSASSTGRTGSRQCRTRSTRGTSRRSAGGSRGRGRGGGGGEGEIGTRSAISSSSARRGEGQRGTHDGSNGADDGRRHACAPQSWTGERGERAGRLREAARTSAGELEAVRQARLNPRRTRLKRAAAPKRGGQEARTRARGRRLRPSSPASDHVQASGGVERGARAETSREKQRS